MFNKLIPDYIFESVHDITPDFLNSIGVSLLISDIDNTLVTYDDEEPTDNIFLWLRSIHEAGITVAFASNNSESRVRIFNRRLGFSALGKSLKPSRRSIFRTMKKLNKNSGETCIVGDQIFTDVLSAKRAGVRAILVKPIKGSNNPFTILKRYFEKQFISEYYRKKAEE